MLLDNVIALVTGTAQGNGAAIARGLAAQGAAVAVCDIDLAGARRTAEALRAEGARAAAYELDVRDAARCAAVARQVGEDLGALGVLVNNAGVRPRHAFDGDERDALWRQAMDVNVDGVRNMTLACLEGLAATRGAVVNITSIAASRASAQSIAYSTSKAAAQMLTKVLALELAPCGIRVNAVAPGVIETAMTQSSRDDPQRRGALMARIPMRRFGSPQDLVGPVTFLASPMSAYVTGAVLAVDGGFLAV
ncbi:SDR family oxidoreductase [Bordetella parapertussis]|uniref:Probable short chain dehydrogenase n=1 Tax=Bordetella parapertussis (strain 12822 / ATCC BAA-587 / NCTC 13253) TaxID=257311 RepID=Q7WBP3_BORPA|nr:SDR family NAD(P)-dependent oxidoreductase [Bordetella parapertussis]AOB37960.1 3-oxoacyl-ACP reductase [Bordetella parapertussis]AUL41933.1 3-oxoacyl-ACP reductase [Bordetella parapertussis]AWP61847.1 3-oxoacyl-ACP reductase [Bordetella parapertussis]AWP69344.1 3-oxoacyl-ACP reductase [Bordetella parapertussis]AWP87937.1 3-oxoacyl-ACP reductase [Bordetella parapertussis]